MFSSTRLTAFVYIALGIAVSAAPAGSPGANIDARSPDLYDLSGGIGALLLGLGGGEDFSDDDSDAYILKRQLAGLDIGSRVGANMGIAHTAGQLGQGLGSGIKSGVEARSPDLYDLSGGLGALLGLGLGGGEDFGDEDSDAYILKRQLAGLDIGSRIGANVGIAHTAGQLGQGLGSGIKSGVEARSPDLYDLSGGLGALLLGLGGGEGFSGEDSDAYILKRQLAGLDIGSRVGANIGIAHTAGQLGQGLGSGIKSGVEARSPDLYDLSGGVGALLLGLGGGEGFGDEDSDAYILKRQLAGLDIGSRIDTNMGIAHTAGQLGQGLGSGIKNGVQARSPDLYDLSGGVGALLLGLGGGEGFDGEDSDAYILKRQLAGLGSATSIGSGANLGSFGSLGLGGDAASLLSSNAGTTDTDTGADASGAAALGAGSGSGFDVNSILSNFGGNTGPTGNIGATGNTGATGNLASSFGIGSQ